MSYMRPPPDPDALPSIIGPSSYHARRPHVGWEHPVPVDLSPRPTSPTFRRTENPYECAASEAAAFRVKYESSQRQLNEAYTELRSKDALIKDLKTEVDAAREGEARHRAVADTLRTQLADCQRLSSTTAEFNRQNVSQQMRISELETQLRLFDEERRKFESQYQYQKSQHESVIARIESSLDRECVGADAIALRVRELQQENVSLRSRLDACSTAEVAAAGSRDTIQRLAADVSQEKHENARLVTQLNNLQAELDRQRADRDSLVHEVRVAKEQLSSVQRSWECCKSELNDREIKLAANATELRDALNKADSTGANFSGFCSELEALVRDFASTDYSSASRSDFILEGVRRLRADLTSKLALIEQLEQKNRSLTQEISSQHNLHQDALHKVNRIDDELRAANDRLRHAEGSVKAQSVLRTELEGDKHKYMEFLDRLARAMRLDQLSREQGFQMNAEALLTRAETLVRREAEGASEKQAHVYTLQRKVKALRDQLESKDMHLDLLRKKVSGLEDRLLSREKPDVDMDPERSRKLQRSVDKYQRELATARAEIRHLKADLLEASQRPPVGVGAPDQTARLAELERYVGHLEHTKHRQARRIDGLRSEVEFQAHTGDHAAITQHSVKALSNELRNCKLALEEGQKRERQLLDLRELVARMLGLDVNTLAVPDYEIISRLERLVKNHVGHTFSGGVSEATLSDMEDGFRQGYDTADGRRRSSARRPRSGSRSRVRSPSPVRKGKSSRPRSPVRNRSPTRGRSPSKVDSRKY